MQNPPKVGELLVHAGVIDELQLKAALAEQAQWGRRIGVTLIKLGMVEENQLVRALAQQLGIPATSLVGRRIAPEVVALVPARIATDHRVVPLFVKRSGSAGKLFLGMEDPSKLKVLDDLSFRTGLEIQPVMMGPTELGQAVDRYYTRRVALEIGGDDDASTGETTIGERSLGLAPEQNSIACSRESRSIDPGFDEASRGGEMGETGEAAMPPMMHDREISFGEPGDIGPEDLSRSVERALRDTEKTRLVVKAITQLLVDQDVLNLDDIQTRIAQLKAGDSIG